MPYKDKNKQKEYKKKWEQKNIIKLRLLKKKYAKIARKKYPERFRAYDKLKREKYAKRIREYARKYKPKKYPLKIKARYLLLKAVRNGVIKKPKKCSKCSSKDIEAHHPNYRFPLKVKWVCPKHHALIHHPYFIKYVRKSKKNTPRIT